MAGRSAWCARGTNCSLSPLSALRPPQLTIHLPGKQGGDVLPQRADGVADVDEKVRVGAVGATPAAAGATARRRAAAGRRAVAGGPTAAAAAAAAQARDGRGLADVGGQGGGGVGGVGAGGPGQAEGPRPGRALAGPGGPGGAAGPRRGQARAAAAAAAAWPESRHGGQGCHVWQRGERGEEVCVRARGGRCSSSPTPSNGVAREKSRALEQGEHSPRLHSPHFFAR